MHMKNMFSLAVAIAGIALLAAGCSKPSTETELTLQLEISDISSTDFIVDVKPSNLEALYFVGLTPKNSQFESFGSLKEVAEWFVQNASDVEGVDWVHADGEYVHQRDLHFNAADWWTIRPGRDYVILAFGVGEGGTVTTEPECEFVSTPAE